jgi:prevent-host-death family protein
MDTVVTVKDVKQRLSELLERAAQGERVIIHQRGKPLLALTRLDAMAEKEAAPSQEPETREQRLERVAAKLGRRFRLSPTQQRRLEALGQKNKQGTLTEMERADALLEDHIIPLSAGGTDDLDNLCWCCWWCNVYKGSQTAAPAPRTRAIVPLFHPRLDRWESHFRWSRNGLRILGRTATGRATVEALRMNDPDRVETRRFWVIHRVHPRDTT